jgi:beta-phosphoglucomutase-like phosphatase (HAD superfamily)
VTGYEVKNHKPAPDIVLEAAKRLGISPKECVVVGDSPIDVEAGKRAGSHTIALVTDSHSRRLLKKANPTIIIENLAALEEVHF